MLVKIFNFGSNWWSRLGPDHKNSDRQTRHTAYYNSTGVHCGGKIRRHWVTSGLIRFNGVAAFNPQRPQVVIGKTFACSNLTQAFGGNRVLFRDRSSKSSIPDRYLVVVSSGVHGKIDFSSNVWKSALSQVIAASELREQQEAMLLMNLGDWVQTEHGFWQLQVSDEPTGLVRIGERIPAR